MSVCTQRACETAEQWKMQHPLPTSRTFNSTALSVCKWHTCPSSTWYSWKYNRLDRELAFDETHHQFCLQPSLPASQLRGTLLLPWVSGFFGASQKTLVSWKVTPVPFLWALRAFGFSTGIRPEIWLSEVEAKRLMHELSCGTGLDSLLGMSCSGLHASWWII